VSVLQPLGYSPEAAFPNPVIFRKSQNNFSYGRGPVDGGGASSRGGIHSLDQRRLRCSAYNPPHICCIGVAALLTLAARVMARVSFPAFCAVPEYVFRVKTGMWRSRCVPIICVRSSALLFFLYFFISSETKLSGAYDWINKSQYVSKTVKARFRNSFPTP
jgi:hypothetical protein